MGADPLFVLAVLALDVALSEWLARHTPLRHLGTALLVIVVTAVSANLGLIPTGSVPVPLYDGIFAVVAPLSIFLLLLGCSLGSLARAGLPMVVLFLVGAAGTLAGVVTGLWVLDGPSFLGELSAPLGGMFVATYVGGSINFNALALHYDVVSQGALYTGAVAVDSIMTSVWMVVTIAVPRLLGLRAARRAARAGEEAVAAAGARTVIDGIDDDTESVHPLDLALLLCLAAGAQWASDGLVGWLEAATTAVASDGSVVPGVRFPSILVLTTLALLLAQLPSVRRLTGARLLGMLGVYLFLAVIGAYCDLSSLAALGSLGPLLFAFVTIVVLVHGALVLGAARLLRWDVDLAAVASQANIGGGTSALALARSLGRADLVLPAILVGSLGTALGTYLGFLASESLLG